MVIEATNVLLLFKYIVHVMEYEQRVLKFEKNIYEIIFLILDFLQIKISGLIIYKLGR